VLQALLVDIANLDTRLLALPLAMATTFMAK